MLTVLSGRRDIELATREFVTAVFGAHRWNDIGRMDVHYSGGSIEATFGGIPSSTSGSRGRISRTDTGTSGASGTPKTSRPVASYRSLRRIHRARVSAAGSRLRSPARKMARFTSFTAAFLAAAASGSGSTRF